MALGTFASVYLPYCLRRQEDGRYVVLNREYKPVGFCTREFITYEDHPVAAKIGKLTERLAERLSWRGDTNTAEIFLYNDGCNPTSSAGNMAAYLERIALLAKLRIDVPQS